MTTTLQQLIDDSVFISTEHQARLAELSQGVEWDVDFSAPSFTLQSDPPVVLTPHLLGTDSTSRGSWIWAWQELGHFPPEVVAAAVQARQTGARGDVRELITDEIDSEDGLARRLTLAAKTVTGIWAHYPARVGGHVTAWLLLEGSELELPALSVETMMRVIAEALQTGTAEDHSRAVDSYVRLRGAHIEWDTEATCVITTRTGAQRLWFEDRRIDAAESADPLVGEQELLALEEQAAARRQALRADRDDALRIAAEQTERDRAARDAEEQARREATAARERAEAEAAEAPVEAAEAPPLPAELSREELEAPVPSSEQPVAAREDEPAYEVSHDERREEPVVTYGGAAADDDLPFDQDPRRDVEPGEVTTSTVPVADAEPAREPVAERVVETEDVRVVEREEVRTDERAEQTEAREPAVGTAEEAEVIDRIGADELREQEADVEEQTVAPADAEAAQPRKKGFLSRFFGR
ncbi:DUF6882 domain-containing protein [Kocuria palustris]|uniref:DUF6882 domain-containing protein n=1 Tax=Kocuria palustris TaxID=71999 RepID=UPI0011A88CE7|nr:DUF6882 domain-containing protein [Kocuria palustris]